MTRILSIRLALCALLLSACGGSSGESTAALEVSAPPPPGLAEPPPGLDLPPADPILGTVLVINGEIIPHEIIRRQVVLGSAGSLPLELAKTEFFIGEELKRQMAAGKSSEQYDVTDDEIQEALAEVEAAVKEQYPGEDVKLEDVLPTSRDRLMNRVAVTKRFLKVFLPPNPDDYPDITLQALNSSDQGQTLLDYLRQHYEESGGDAQFNLPMITGIIFQELSSYMAETSDIERGDDLPASVVLRINGQDILVDKIWEQIEDGISPVEVREAKQWLVNMRLMEQDLSRQGLWLSEEEAAKTYAEHSDPYKESLFSVERMAVAVKKYPSVDAYVEFRRVHDSFQQAIRNELNPDDLRRFAKERTMPLVGQAQVDCDVILLSAFDFRKGAWKSDGWADAERRAEEVLQQLVVEERPWDEVLDGYSDFYDPPQMEDMARGSNTLKQKGRFRGKQRNVLLNLLGESEYWHFLNGTTLTDYIFFEQEVGTVSEPTRGPYGWYITKLLRRAPAPARLDLDDEMMITMAEQDYTIVRLSEYVQELIDQNEVYGLD